MNNAIELSGVRKMFGTSVAVDDLSFSVPVGTISGFIGPNGSGKTTTLRMLMNILRPDQGTIQVFGTPKANTRRSDISYLPEEKGLYRKMKVSDQLRYIGQLRGARGAALEASITDWLQRLGLASYAEKRIETLSKGMEQKVQFIAATLGSPKLLILDEPFSGLDPATSELLMQLVLDLKRTGATVLFSTHDMACAERLCDRICMIFRGRKVLDDTLDAIQKTSGVLRISVEGGALTLAQLPEVTVLRERNGFYDVRVSGDPQELLRKLIALGRVDHFEHARSSLHDIFVNIVSEQSPKE